ncbi:MAG: bifunctional methionine sulfoxide reductase B/A protein [Candidatus Thermoplasmatota archaeon]|jgi:peptide methionine sulfoxide reductase msrA/msrB|nr:bifunctional methionine sulfoxide reductase B/A protein [Candidatus Thermoplasmatota archaeon]
MKLKRLTPEEESVMIHKGTEKPFTGEYNDHFLKGTYLCRQCGTALYLSEDKLDSKCGWPSFDREIEGAVERIPDPDGIRTEIVCASCGGHLGHVFTGEGLTPRDVRHCVNSISLKFESEKPGESRRAIFAGGCFWGVEYYMKKQPGVLKTTVGYTGGHKENPSYTEVCAKNTGHIEAVEILYDPSKVSFEDLAKLFFEIHDPTQIDRQGPDVGEQYRSMIFYTDEEQMRTCERLIEMLKENGLSVATKLVKAGKFWKAEDYHQDYYQKKGMHPYCHGYTERFWKG